MATQLPLQWAAPAEAARLSGQCKTILERLRQGRMTNKELSAISLKYTGRISDLRAAGYTVKCISRDHDSGVTVYELLGEPNA